RRLQTAFAQELSEQDFAAAIRWERSLMHFAFEVIMDGKANARIYATSPSLMGRQALEIRMMQLIPGYLIRQHAHELRLYTDFIEALKSPREHQEGRLRQVFKASAGGSFHV